ncbi:hypothetical protein HO173_013376 [Letharia columbiana]|uniref:Uncharacterized protein n=1 Tax=Letharia columbiana TaxID=112416 RepID=A0A8H6FC80_9LECA|nr:uncharacterized protein HO173_013376 [Letharia columbiana]KAF6222543.1 hypothetical protein HO173_013376 [Letharia columbiana]
MEDAGALGHLFRSVHDPATIEKRLQLFWLVRKDRVSRTQIMASVRAGREKKWSRSLRSMPIRQDQPFRLHTKNELTTTMIMMFSQNVRKYF